jgi:hypothetical protein
MELVRKSRKVQTFSPEGEMLASYDDAAIRLWQMNKSAEKELLSALEQESLEELVARAQRVANRNLTDEERALFAVPSWSSR